VFTRTHHQLTTHTNDIHRPGGVIRQRRGRVAVRVDAVGCLELNLDDAPIIASDNATIGTSGSPFKRVHVAGPAGGEQ
jgi:hypothetical protein